MPVAYGRTTRDRIASAAMSNHEAGARHTAFRTTFVATSGHGAARFGSDVLRGVLSAPRQLEDANVLGGRDRDERRIGGGQSRTNGRRNGQRTAVGQ